MCGARVKHKTKRFERFFVRGRRRKGDKKKERQKKRENFFVCDELGFRMFQRERE